MNTRLVQFALLALVSFIAGCTSWARLHEGRPVPERGTVQAWNAGQATLLREPVTQGDSLVGRAPLPDTTRRSVALASIDSVRVQDVDMGKVVIVGTGVAIAALLYYSSKFD